MKTINDAFPSLALRGLNALGAALLFAGGALSGNSALAQENSLLAAITHTTTLPGSGHSWGFAAQDPTRPYLFIARRENGLTVFDVEKQRVVRSLDNSAGANAVVFVPSVDRAYITNMDGSLTIVRLSDLMTLKRIPVADANLNSAVYEPVTGWVIIASGRRADKSTLFVLDPKEDRIVAQQDVDVKKIDPLVAVGDGTILLPMRDEGKVMRIAAASLKTSAIWRFDGCTQPSALALDPQNRRLFVACRGNSPILVVADLDSGALKASLPITHAVNAVAYDAKRRRLLVASGVDANLTVIAQSGPNDYRTLGFVGTRPWAHNMAYDPQRGQAYLFTMDFTQPAPGPDLKKQDPQFHADSFSVLTMQLR